MSLFRFGAALSHALARESLRQAAADVRGVELVVASSTTSSVVGRTVRQPLDAIVIDIDTPDAEQSIRDLMQSNARMRLFVISTTPTETANRLSLRNTMMIDGNGSPDRVVATVMERIGELVAPAQAPPAPVERRATPSGFKRREIVVLGCSTGGPEALAVVLGQLPPTFPVPILVVQHMPPDFTRLLAERLDKSTELTVKEVGGPTKARAGEVWIAPGHQHIKLTGVGGQIELDDGPEENNCKPAVDVLFRSAAETYGRRSVGVVLTGMGDDGCRGGQKLAATGAYMIAQDEATSVVWGMPGAITRAGHVDAVVPLERVASELQQQFRAAPMGVGA